MAREFVIMRRDGWGPHVSLTEMLRRGRAATKPGRRYQLTKNGEPIGNRRRRYLALAALARQARFGRIGSTYALRDDDSAVFRTREAKPAVTVINTNGNRKADVAWSYVKAKYPRVRFLGAYVCKYISGSGGAMSQHSYGNAVDIGADTMAQLYDIAYDLVRHEGVLDLENVIVDDRIWTRGVGWHAYGGDRHYHCHTDFTPSLSGACGVRG
jgi:hypothetical protein